MSELCDERVNTDVFKMFTSNFTENSFLSVLSNVAPTFEDTFLSCNFGNKWSICKDVLSPMITEEGICFVFNAMNINEIVTDV